MTYRYLKFEPETIKILDSICPIGYYCLLSPAEYTATALPFVPERLKGKLNAILIVASGNATGTAYAMAMCYRVDQNDNKFDQEPIMIAYRPQQCDTASGYAIHHGKWPGRFTDIPADFQSWIDNTGLGYAYPLSGLPTNTRGRIEELAGYADYNRFQVLVSKLRDRLQTEPYRWDDFKTL